MTDKWRIVECAFVCVLVLAMKLSGMSFLEATSCGTLVFAAWIYLHMGEGDAR